MDLYHKILTGVIILLIVGGIFLGVQWLAAHDAALKAQAKVEADQAAFDKLTSQQKELADQLVALKREQAEQLTAVRGQFNQAQSPTQVATLMAQLMGLKSTPVIVTPPATADNPHPQPVAQLPLDDAPQVKAYALACEECKVNYKAAQKEAEIARQDKVVAETKLGLVTDQRDEWKKAATGGSWVRRAGKRLGHFAVDAVVVGLVLCGSGHCK